MTNMPGLPDDFVLGYDLDLVPIRASDPDYGARLEAVLSDPRRIVGRDRVRRGLWVSTVFLGVDHGLLRDGPAILWETMAWRGGERSPRTWCAFQWRYPTREAALAGHAWVVEFLAGGGDVDYLDTSEAQYEAARTYAGRYTKAVTTREDANHAE